MAFITLLTLLLQSLLFLPLVYFHNFLTKKVNAEIMDSIMWSHSTSTPNQIITFYLAILLLAVIPFGFSCRVISSTSATAVMLVTATSYAGKKSSLQYLFSRIKRKGQKGTRAGANPRSLKATLSLFVAVAFAAVPACLVIFGGINVITATIVVVVGVPVIVLLVYASAVASLAAVVSAVERAQLLVVGHRLDCFMINLSASLMFGIVLMCYWSVLGDVRFLNFGMHGLVFINSVNMVKIFACVAHTVLYFHCKKHHGQEIDVLG